MSVVTPRNKTTLNQGPTEITTATGKNLPIQLGDTPQLDAFGRLRVSNPSTIFDSKQLFDNQPLFWDDQQTSGSGTTSTHNVNEAMSRMKVGAATAGTRVRQTFRRFNYQPGKSFMVVMTMVLHPEATGDLAITRRVGYFDENNGLFIEDIGGTVSFVRRTKASGSVVNNKTVLPLTFANGTTINWTKTQIIFIDMEWLGVGRVRFGIFNNGVPEVLHTENMAGVLTVPYMSTPNLPIRYEISNSGSGAAQELDHICATVISEGGMDAQGILRHSSTKGVHVLASVADTVYALFGTRLKATHLGCTMMVERTSVIAETNDDYQWILIFNPTIAGAFTYSDLANSCVQTATGATANTVTGGVHVDSGFSKSSGDATSSSRNALLLGSAIDGTRDTLVLCARPLSSNARFQGGYLWRELQ